MNDAAANLTVLFLALADKTRLRILNLLTVQEVSVLNFVNILQEPQPKISRHLAYLRDAKLVETRRDGKWIYYRLTMPNDSIAQHVLGELLVKLTEDEQMKKDREQLQQAALQTSVEQAKDLNKEDSPKPKRASSKRKQKLDVFLL